MSTVSRVLSVVVASAALAASSAMLAGCASSGPQRAQATTNSMADARAALDTSAKQIGQTLASMNRLAEARSGDLRPLFDQFTRDIAATQTQAADVTARATAMRNRGHAYFENWEREASAMQTESVRERSLARRDEVLQSYNAITTRMEEAREAYKPFMQKLQDLRTAISNDLNPNGIAAVSDLVSQANAGGKEVLSKITAVSNEIEKFKAAMGSTR